MPGARLDTDVFAPPAAPDLEPADSPGGAAGRPASSYAHLAPLFVELVRLPADHPRRAALRATLITGHLPVARNIARRFVHRGDTVEDLEQVATLGLIGAVDRFDPDRGFDFLSFAVPAISGEVRRYFRDRVRTIRIPRRVTQLQAAVYEAATELTQTLGRAPRPSELAERVGAPIEDVLEVLQAHHAAYPASLDEPAPDDDRPGRGWMTVLGDVDPGLGLVEDRAAVVPLLAGLPDRERRILQLRFFHDLTQTEIAALTGISQMHVSRLLSRTLTALRSSLTPEV
jgi:RNA polymerase sigma-B factor